MARFLTLTGLPNHIHHRVGTFQLQPKLLLQSTMWSGLPQIRPSDLPENGVSMRRALVSRVDLRFSFIGFLPLLTVATHVVSPPCFYTHYV